MNEKFINFKEEINNIKQFYSTDIKRILNFNEEEKKIFFKSEIKKLNIYLKIILENEENRMNSIFEYNSDYNSFNLMSINYCLLGIFFELLIKICLLKNDWKNYIKKYLEQYKNKKFDYAKDNLIEILNNKNLNNKQIERVEDILTFIQLQRNNFVHSPFNAYDTIGTENQCFQLIIILNNLFDLGIKSEYILKLFNNIAQYNSQKSGLQLEEVFDREIKEIYKNLKPKINEAINEELEKNYYEFLDKHISNKNE